MKKLFTLFLALVASVGIIYASDTQVDGIWYDFDESNKTATVTYRGRSFDSYYDEYSGSIVIPASLSYNGITFSVTSIGDEAFRECFSLTSVTIGNSVTSIGERAFWYCESLTSVTIPNSVTSIGYCSFCGCSSVTSITIPNSVTSIGDGAFASCSSLASATIPNGVTSIGDGAFSRCSSLVSVTIPNGVTSIGKQAFAGCYFLTSITIPNGVTSIGEQAFQDCYFLTYITIPNSVTSIGDYAFQNCKSLTSVTIGNSVTSIGEGAFRDCSSLTSINVDANNANYCSINGVFFNKDKTTLIQYPIGNTRSEYTIPNSVTSIRSYAFSGCSSLTSVTIPNSVTSIGSYAFAYCKSLTSVINYATQPQAIDGGVFLYVDISACQLYILSTSVGLYQTAEEWKDFGNIQPIRAEDITDVSETIITPSENEVEITWPSVSGAASYELVIKDKDGNIVCTLIFNANGQLTSIAFNAPSRNGAPAQTQNAGFSFTITGLDSGTGYDLTLTAKDNSGNAIQTETISFVTTGGNVSTDIDQLQGHKVQSTKVIKDGQVLILRNGKTYTMQGQEVK